MVGNRWASRGNLPFKSKPDGKPKSSQFAVVKPPKCDGRMRLLAAAGHKLRTPIMHMRLRAEFVEDDENGTCGSPISMSSSASPPGVRRVGEGRAGGPELST